MPDKDHTHSQIELSVAPSQEIIPAASRSLDRAALSHDVPEQGIDIGEVSRIALLSDPRSPEADRFRFLRMRLRDFRRSAPLRSLMITSALPGDGKSRIALNLAATLAEEEKHSVLLIEADLHCPTLAQDLGIPAAPGLAEYLEEGIDPVLSLRRIHPLHFHLMQAGTAKLNPASLLQSASFSSLMDIMCSRFDWVLIDTPPVVPLTDALLVSRQVDGSLFVIRAGHTPREAAEEALSRLRPNRAIGIVFNGAEELSRLYAKYSRYYGRK